MSSSSSVGETLASSSPSPPSSAPAPAPATAAATTENVIVEYVELDDFLMEHHNDAEGTTTTAAAGRGSQQQVRLEGCEIFLKTANEIMRERTGVFGVFPVWQKT